MKSKKINRVIYAALGVLLSSCNVLDIEPLDSYTEKSIFSDPVLTTNYVTTHYTFLETGWGDWNDAVLRFVSDESMNNFSWENSWNINKGEMAPDLIGGLDTWKAYYANIRSCNIFFENMKTSTALDTDLQASLVAEMTFFRAFYYMDLVSRFGGVPLITKVFELEDSNMFVTRDSYEDCLNFIIAEFDKAAAGLPEVRKGAEFGRATKGAALASNDVSKWEDAAKAAEQVMDLTEANYTLHNSYKDLFLTPASSEIIFQRLYTTEYGHWMDSQSSPNGYNGYSATCITQEMVDSYEMADGTMPNKSIYDTATTNPWADREPRFYASIVCDGQQFRGREVEFWVNEDKKSGGKDSAYGIDAWNYSKSYYTLRKFMNESLLKSWVVKSDQPWIYCRLAEIYLNYAEAKYHMGDEDTAREYINKVRSRARGGNSTVLPDITATGGALLLKIQQERKIELAFEEHRFFDVRRWKIAEQTEKVPAHGIEIVKNAAGDKSYSFLLLQERNFIAPKHYLLPVPHEERLKNPKLDQNPGY